MNTVRKIGLTEGEIITDTIIYIEDVEKTDRKRRCKFKCICGNFFEAEMANIITKNTKSCGCLRQKPKSHGHRLGHNQSSEYTAWCNMKERCTNTLSAVYFNYGGRGITICDEWVNNFEKFYADMGNKPFKDYSLDRINVNDNYCKDNCRWANIEEQSNNKRNCRYITIGDVTKTISQWERYLNLKRTNLKYYIKTNQVEERIIELLNK